MKAQFLKFTIIFLIFSLGIEKNMAITYAAPDIMPYLYISSEVGGGNMAANRNLIDLQDDTWRIDATSLGATSFTRVDFGTQVNDGHADLQPNNPGPYPPGNPITNPLAIPDGTYFSFPSPNGVTLRISLLNMDGGTTF